LKRNRRPLCPINDDYFRSVKAETSNNKAAKKNGEIYEAKKDEYKAQGKNLPLLREK
jgi:hypothetical protein